MKLPGSTKRRTYKMDTYFSVASFLLNNAQFVTQKMCELFCVLLKAIKNYVLFKLNIDVKNKSFDIFHLK
jgi:hypothetical protein